MKFVSVIFILASAIFFQFSVTSQAQGVAELTDEVLKNWTYPLGDKNSYHFVNGEYNLSNKDLDELLGCEKNNPETSNACERASLFYNEKKNLYDIQSIQYGPKAKNGNQAAVVIIGDNENAFFQGNGIPFIAVIVQLIDGKISSAGSFMEDRLAIKSIKFNKTNVSFAYLEGKQFVNGKIRQNPGKKVIEIDRRVYGN